MKHTPRFGSPAGLLSLLPISLWLLVGLVVLYLHLFFAPTAIAAPVSLGNPTNAVGELLREEDGAILLRQSE